MRLSPPNEAALRRAALVLLGFAVTAFVSLARLAAEGRLAPGDALALAGGLALAARAFTGFALGPPSGAEPGGPALRLYAPPDAAPGRHPGRCG